MFTTDRLLAMARAFMESRILITAAELDLFTLLAGAPLSATEIAERREAAVRPMAMLLDALAALGLLVKDEGRYRTEPSVAPLLAAGAPGSVLAMVLHTSSLWRTWSALTERVRGQPLSRSPRAPDELRAFIGAMHVVGTPVADRLANLMRPGDARALLDIGGGPGTYALAFLRASATLKVTLFDRAEVVEMARERIAAAGMLDRVKLLPGDFYTDELPGGHDLALLSAIIHQNSSEQNVALYRKVFAALVPGGRLLIRDHVMKPDRTRPVAGAIFAINMLVATEGGGTYTLEEIEGELRAAGFERVRLLQEGERMDGVVEAFRPA